MKQKIANKIYQANQLASRCPKIEMFRATATAGVYVKAYDDFSTIMEHLTYIIYNTQQIDGWKACIKREKRKDPYFNDEEILEEILLCEESIDNSLEKLKKYVEMREDEHWN